MHHRLSGRGRIWQLPGLTSLPVKALPWSHDRAVKFLVQKRPTGLPHQHFRANRVNGPCGAAVAQKTDCLHQATLTEAHDRVIFGVKAGKLWPTFVPHSWSRSGSKEPLACLGQSVRIFRSPAPLRLTPGIHGESPIPRRNTEIYSLRATCAGDNSVFLCGHCGWISWRPKCQLWTCAR